MFFNFNWGKPLEMKPSTLSKTDCNDLRVGARHKHLRLPIILAVWIIVFCYFANLHAQSNPSNSPWPIYRSDVALTAQAKTNGPTSPDSIRTFSMIGAREMMSPVVAEDSSIIFTLFNATTVYAVKPLRDHKANLSWIIKWRYSVRDTLDCNPAGLIQAPPVIGKNNVVYVGTTGGCFFAIKDGKFRWVALLKGEIISSANVSSNGMNELIYVTTNDGNFYVLRDDGTRATEIRNHNFGGRARSSTPAIDWRGYVYVAHDSIVHVFDRVGQLRNPPVKMVHPKGGTFEWVVVSPYPSSIVLAGSKNDPALVVFHMDSGDTAWTLAKQAFGSFKMPALANDGRLFLVSEAPAGQLIALNAGNGDRRRVYDDLGGFTNMPVVDAAGRVYVVAKAGNEHVLYSIMPNRPAGNNVVSWKRTLESGVAGNEFLRQSPAFGPDSTIYVPGYSKLYVVAIQPRLPDSLIYQSGNGQQDCIGSTLPMPLRVKVQDQYRRPLVNCPVRFLIRLGDGGTASAPTDYTDNNGIAETFWTLGSKLGEQEIEATAEGANGPLKGSPVIFTATGTLPQIGVTPASLDFHEACLENSGTDSLKITNFCSVPLEVSLIPSDTAYRLDRQTLQIPPNRESEWVKVTFSPTEIKPYPATIRITMNDRNRYVLDSINVAGVGIGPNIRGDTTLQFDYTAVNAVSEKDFFIYNNSQCTLRNISLAIKNGEDSTFYFCRPDTIERHFIEPNGSLEVCLRFAPRETGNHTDTLFIFSNDSLNNPYKVLLEGTAVPCLPEITIKPDSLIFGEACINSSKKLNLTISNDRCADVRAILFSSDSAFRAEPDTVELAPNSSKTVAITFYPKLAKDYPGTLTITINDPNQSSWQINLRGEGIGAKVNRDTTEVVFAPTELGQKTTRAYTISNRGQCDLRIDSLRIKCENPDDFSIISGGNGPPLPPGRSRLVELQFWPKALGERNACLLIYSNDPTGEAFSVRLRGKGTCALPTIVHSQPALPWLGDSVKIEATVNAGCSNIASFKLLYRQGGKSGFSEKNFSGNITTIPNGSVTRRGVEYAIIAKDNLGNETWFPSENKFYSLQVRLPADSVWTRHHGGATESAYRIRSFPLELDEPSAKAIVRHNFPFTNPDHLDPRFERLWDIDPAKAESMDPYREYPEVGTFAPGRAMFLITRGTITLKNTAARTVRTVTAFVIPLHQGWNLVASPFNFEIPFQNSSLIRFLGRACAYPGAWQEIGPSFKFKPWEGVMIKARHGESLTILPSEEALNAIPNANDAPAKAGADWFIRINAFCRGAKDVINTAGVAPDAAMEWDAYESLEPPPIGDYVTAYFSHHDWQKYPDFYTTDFRPRSDDGYEWNFEIQTSFRGEAVNLQFENIQSLPPELQVRLIDVDLNFPQDLRREPAYRFRSSDIEKNKHRFRLIVGKDEFVEKKLVGIFQTPQKFELAQNFPNPFNPVTTIKFGLPKTASVSLIVYNVKGEVIRPLIGAQEKEAGYHVVLWDGRDESGNSVASGLYFYQLKAGNLTLTRKMILAK